VPDLPRQHLDHVLTSPHQQPVLPNFNRQATAQVDGACDSRAGFAEKGLTDCQVVCLAAMNGT
jgi:hypothetical protein